MNIISVLHYVHNFAHMDLSNEDRILITLTTGIVMCFESYFDEDYTSDCYRYYDMKTNVGIESFDINDIINYAE